MELDLQNKKTAEFALSQLFENWKSKDFKKLNKYVQKTWLLNGDKEEFKRMFGMFGMEVPNLEPFIYLGEGDLSLGKGDRKIDLQILLTPGHSPGSICLYWQDKRILITGDVVFYGSIGRTDFPGGSIATLRQSIEKLSSLEVEYLLPGHSTEYGSIVEGKEMVRRNFNAIQFLF